MAGDFGVPAASGCVVAERGGVGELGLELRDELGVGGVVVVLLADVGVGQVSAGSWREQYLCATRVLSISARSPPIRPGMMGWPAGAIGSIILALALLIASS